MTGLLAQAAGTPRLAEAVVFWVAAVVALGAGLAMITLRNIVHAALMLVVNFVAIAALYLALQSSFLAIIQVIVYAGAIMVLFLFVIMLIGISRDDLLHVSRWQRVAAGAGGLVLAGMLVFAFVGPYTSAASRCGDQAAAGDGSAVACAGLTAAVAETGGGSVGVVAETMFTRYTFPFEAAALLLVVATVGALILGRRHDPDPDRDQAFAVAGGRRRAAAGAGAAPDDESESEPAARTEETV